MLILSRLQKETEKIMSKKTIRPDEYNDQLHKEEHNPKRKWT